MKRFRNITLAVIAALIMPFALTSCKKKAEAEPAPVKTEDATKAEDATMAEEPKTEDATKVEEPKTDEHPKPAEHPEHPK